jgi:hypothetical protein
MSEGKTSDKNIVLYLSLWFNAFKELNAGISKDDLAKRIAELEEKIRILTAENEELRHVCFSCYSYEFWLAFFGFEILNLLLTFFLVSFFLSFVRLFLSILCSVFRSDMASVAFLIL